MPRKHRPNSNPSNRSDHRDQQPADLRIIGGDLRGRRIMYAGDPRTRPMKNRVREAVFNLLGSQVKGMHAIDLFAGTGALGLEALSRGATRATLVEQHFPTAEILRQNVAALGLAERAEVVAADTFIWTRREFPGKLALTDAPWLVFSSPPYAFYIERRDEMLALLKQLLASAPPGSLFVVEADERFDFAFLPGQWDVRKYPPAVIGVRRL